MIRPSTPAPRMWPVISVRSIVTILLVAAVAFTQAIPQAGASLLVKRGTAGANKLERARLSDNISIRVEGRGAPYTSLSDGRNLITAYRGPADLIERLEDGNARPLALASADYDEDGVPDLVCGYESEGRGIITLHRGNIDSIYPNSPEARYRKSIGEFTDSPFLSPGRVFPLPGKPDFIAAGDFNADGHWDLAAASRHSVQLQVLTGDGRGVFRTGRQVELAGAVTAMTSGEINRRDGLADIVVGVSAASGPHLLIFEGPGGALTGKPEIIRLPAEVTSLSLGEIDGSHEIDLAAAAGNRLILVRGRDRKLSFDESQRKDVTEPQISDRVFSAVIESVAVGNFADQHMADVALFFADGSVRVMERTAYNRGGAKSDSIRGASELDVSDWPVREVTRVGSERDGQQHRSTVLLTARTSGVPADNLVLYNTADSQLYVIADLRRGLKDESPAEVDLAKLDVTESGPVAAMPMLLNGDALSDLVILTRDSSAPAILQTQPQATFTVTSANDSGAGTLRQAILDANASSGADTISFNIPGGGAPTIRPLSPLPAITDAVTIDATTQPGGRVELDGSSLSSSPNGIIVTGGNSRVRGLVINRFPTHGISILERGGNIIEGNNIGTNVAGTAPLGNVISGITLSSTSGNTIGGTTTQARNILSGNGFDGVTCIQAVTNTQIMGNLIGTDAGGMRAVGNLNVGIQVSNDSINNTIGGTTAGARNLISGNAAGILVFSFPGFGLASGNLIQGNLVGTDIGGAAAIPNPGNGTSIIQCPDNTVGGTTPAARNIISGNGALGVTVFGVNSGGNFVQGNYIGANIIENSTSSITDIPVASPYASDLSITSTDSSDPVASGEKLTYTYRVNNPGPDAAENVVVSSAIPIGTTFSSLSTSQGESSQPGAGQTGAVSCRLGTIQAGGSATITLVVNVVTAAGTTITNIASVISSSADPNSANNSATAVTQVQGGGVVALSWQQPQPTAANPTPAPTSLELNPGTAIGISLGNTVAGIVSVPFDGKGAVLVSGNVIANNGGPGIIVSTLIDRVNLPTTIEGNSIAFNGGLGIFRDSPDDPNFLVARPGLTSASGSTVRGTLTGRPNSTYRVELFANSVCDASGSGEGERFIGFTSVTTDANGNGSFTLTSTNPLGRFVTATATDPQGNTSEFSQCLAVGGQQSQDLSVRRVRTEARALPGDNGSYSITVTNTSGEAVRNFTLCDALPANARLVEVFPGPPVNDLRESAEITQQTDCFLLGYNIYISSTQPVQTVPANLWRSVPATNTANAPAAPAGSFYVVTTLWACGANVVESGGSNQVGVPAGPTLQSAKVSGKIKISGSNFSSPAEVFIDGVGFAKAAKVTGKVVQKGALEDGRSISEATPVGRTVLVSIRNANGGIGSVSFTRQ